MIVKLYKNRGIYDVNFCTLHIDDNHTDDVCIYDILMCAKNNLGKKPNLLNLVIQATDYFSNKDYAWVKSYSIKKLMSSEYFSNNILTICIFQSNQLNMEIL